MVDLINRRRNQIMVHSYIYYGMNDSLVPDNKFDEWCKELVELQELYPKESKMASYYKEFIGFDGSSGYDLPYDTEEIKRTAERLIDYRE